MFKLSFRLQVLVGFALSVILVLVVGILSSRNINQLESDTDAVDHTQLVIKKSNNLLQLMIDAETGMRGYVATGDQVFLDPYKQALPVISVDLEQLRSLTQQNPEQLKRVDSLSLYITLQLGILKENIDTRQARGLDYVIQKSMLLNGKHNMDEIRALTDLIINSENHVLAVRKESSAKSSDNVLLIIVSGSGIFLLIIVLLFFYIERTFARQKEIEHQIKESNSTLEEVLAENEDKNWLLTGTALLNEKMQGQQGEKLLCENILADICGYSGALTGTLYLYNQDTEYLDLYASYAFSDHDSIKKTTNLKDGWLGRAAKDKRPVVVKGRLNDKLSLSSSLISQELTESFIVPFFFEKKLMGVIEIAFQDEIGKKNSEYILTVAEDIGIVINTAQARTLMHDLLSQVQQQAEELEAQQEEMRVTNEELLTKTELLQESDEELRSQQEELRTVNVELEEKASLLEEKNKVIEQAREAIDLKVQELERTGRYRSEFLANMSHELRTPLNSILVLAQVLKENRATNLTNDQVKYADVILTAGNDLLTLINDILDLSKIESGKTEIENEMVAIAGVANDMDVLFAQVAAGKKIKYSINVRNDVPKYFFTDKVKIEQVLKNLLSNAFKFTPDKGTVALTVTKGDDAKTIKFSIKDSGIGIPEDKQKIIFEAFQQADGSTSRRYGGTGLGLSISRELTSLLGGTISLNSKPGNGSEFILTLPVRPGIASQIEVAIAEPIKPTNGSPKREAGTLAAPEKEPVVIILEDDANFAVILEDYAREHGFVPMIINDGTHAVETIRQKQPEAVILDIKLPGKDGWQILKELKHDKETMHIPVHLMSAGDAAVNRVQREGAMGFLKKPIEKSALDRLFQEIIPPGGPKQKRILLVEDKNVQSTALEDFTTGGGFIVDRAFDGKSTLRMLSDGDYHCVILDLNLPDIPGLDLLDKIKTIEQFNALPIIVNTAMELDKNSVRRLMKYANAMVVKTDKPTDRLIDEVNLFLNKVTSTENLPKVTAKEEVKLKPDEAAALKGRKILIVDDDLRNIFALSSVLQDYGMAVEIAGDGREAINKLEKINDIELVLMDVMMPVMDGYEATRHIRQQDKWRNLPVIALTAKAMTDDREKCMEAGASDYIVKPVEIKKLILLIQLWLGL